MFLASVVPTSLLGADTPAGRRPVPPEPSAINRYIVIDNVCAWPNLTLLPDGTIAAVIHNQVHHGRMFGAIDCWVSEDGQFWEKRGVPVPNEPLTVRMNHAAGVAGNGDLVVLCSGYKHATPPWVKLPVAVARSSDNGRTWTHHTEFPVPEEAESDLVPFGDIAIGDDGVLYASAYGSGKSWFLHSQDDGNTWKIVSIIARDNNETTILHLGGGKWLAGARRSPPPDGAGPDAPNRVVDLFFSSDNGASWQGPHQLTNNRQHPGHLLLLADGRVLFTYGNRSGAEGGTGVLAKSSSDQGKTWSSPIRIAHVEGDLGYPSSVQRSDGKIVTAYYSGGIKNHQRYHMGVAIWEVPDMQPGY